MWEEQRGELHLFGSFCHLFSVSGRAAAGVDFSFLPTEVVMCRDPQASEDPRWGLSSASYPTTLLVGVGAKAVTQ